MCGACRRRTTRPLPRTMSAPSSSGFWKKGDMNVLSTTRRMPWARATGAIAAMSVTLSLRRQERHDHRCEPDGARVQGRAH